MLQDTYRSLEFEEIRRIVAGFVSSPMGGSAARAIKPFPDAESATKELQAVEECRVWMEEQGEPSLSLAADPTPILERVGITGVVLEPSDLLLLAGLGRVGMEVKAALRSSAQQYPLLHRRFSNLANFSPLIADLEKKIQPNGELADNASPALRQLRRSIQGTRIRIQETLQDMLQGANAAAFQDQFITERNGRYVLPVRSDTPRKVDGVVHGTSSSGATLFVEPMKTVALNNQLVQSQEKEREEVHRILSELSERIHLDCDDWIQLLQAVTYLDLLVAKVRFQRVYSAVIPRITGKEELFIREARHPLLVEQFKTTGVPVVPITLHLEDSRRILVLSGPNTGGKTVALKTVGLISLMSACGLPVTAEDANIHFFRHILVDIGDQQSIQSNLSTFSAHLLSLNAIMRQAEAGSLVLLDEVGTGTDPEQGAALAIAVIEHLKKRGALVIATTHYNRLKAYAYQAPSVANMAVEFDAQSMRPTFRLIDGVAGGSSGLEIAARLGMDPEVIQAARRIVDPKDIEADIQLEGIRKKLAELESAHQQLGIERQIAARERIELQQDFRARRDKLEKELQRRFDDQFRSFKLEGDRILKELRGDIERSRYQRSTERRLEQLKSKKQRGVIPGHETAAVPSAAETDRRLRPGDRVRILSLEQEGIVERADSPKVEISISGKRWKIERDDLALVTAADMPTVAKGPRRIAEGVILDTEGEEALPQDLNLIGCKVEDALQRADKFLDQCVLAGRRSIRLVHGHGKGVLRRALAEFLKGHPHVAAARSADENEGGAAVTLVQLNT